MASLSRLLAADRVNAPQIKVPLKHRPPFLNFKGAARFDLHESGPMLPDAVVWLLEQLHDPRAQVARLTDPNPPLLVEEGENPACLRNGLNRFQGEIVRPLGKVPLGLHVL